MTSEVQYRNSEKAKGRTQSVFVSRCSFQTFCAHCYGRKGTPMHPVFWLWERPWSSMLASKFPRQGNVQGAGKHGVTHCSRLNRKEKKTYACDLSELIPSPESMLTTPGCNMGKNNKTYENIVNFVKTIEVVCGSKNNRRMFRSQTSDNMGKWKAKVGRVKEEKTGRKEIQKEKVWAKKSRRAKR